MKKEKKRERWGNGCSQILGLALALGYGVFRVVTG